MHYEVVFAGSGFFDVFKDFCYDVELVVPREDESFFAGFFVFCEMEVFVEEFEEVVFCEDVFPEVGGGVTPISGGGVSFSAGVSGAV